MAQAGRSKSAKENWIYGINPVSEGIRSGRKISCLYVLKQKYELIKNIIQDAGDRGIPVKYVDKEFFDSRFDKGHQSIAALIEPQKAIGFDSLLELPGQRGETAFFLILDCIEDPRNLGAILRVADAAGVHRVVIQSHRSAGISPFVSKASAGAVEHVNVVEVVNIKHAIDKMKKMDISIIGAEAGSNNTPWDIKMDIPVALVIGSEGHGLRRTVKDMCDYIVSLPMQGKVNSLNASVAAGILAYEALRQRR
jgi:23S rRNA (guanosine2251-2'-O)-methyltransferase